MLSYQGCHMRAVHWLYWNSCDIVVNDIIVKLSDVIISGCISAHSGTSVSLFKHENAVFNGEQEKESISPVRVG